ncbi:hypothetical protein ONS95_000939 [Cadophora gregata]|uniref:uncharacterized protein n=1 Tax=Cadophora gregata TaxID=51156 RepID=UPI0026DC9137|nr:uncharacterized protein ONS95_000939 [Cadophora gregata]KAK0128998.1 hypothetical protein ONS95_000939 [Cadophora gregata]
MHSDLVAVLEFGKWSCLGMFLFLESCTILDAMGVYQTYWAAGLFVEAMKFWFFSLTLGIFLALMELWDMSGQGPVVREGDDGENRKDGTIVAQDQDSRARERSLKRWNVVKKIVIDVCDLSIPGSITGWLTVSPGNAGMLCIVSTALTGLEIWDRI